MTLPIVSCNENFLERTPLDQISEPDFWKSTSDLELYANSFYNSLPTWSRVGTGFAYMPDNHSDISVYSEGISDRIQGTASVPAASTNSIWNWSAIRRTNYFLDNVEKAEGNVDDIDHFTGEGYFFRAWAYYSKLTSYGAAPIIDTYFGATDTDYLYAARSSRNEVADFILADLDMAISKLKTKASLNTPRISKEAALLFKARVALYEGTWEKYHNGSDFGVSGSDGSAYLQIAATASKELIDGSLSLYQGDYQSLFNKVDHGGNNEVILWRQYDFVSFGNTYGNDMNQTGPNRSGITRSMVRSYLSKDGDPIGVSPLYQGDATMTDVIIDRDPRLGASIMVPGDILTISASGDTTIFEVPRLTSNNHCPTAYEYKKFKEPVVDASTGSRSKNISKIIMRYAEALLIYAEAKAESGSLTQQDLDISINKLRDRVGMPHITLGAITVDPDWPDYGYAVSPELQEIRRERAVELMGEGFRFGDLMRWRAHNLFVGKRPRGAFYEDLLRNEAGGLHEDTDGYLDPLKVALPNGYGFNPDRDYLNALPEEELVVNENLTQNPGW